MCYLDLKMRLVCDCPIFIPIPSQPDIGAMKTFPRNRQPQAGPAHRPEAGPTHRPEAGPTHRPKGFTLIELLVVMAIIAVLAAAGFQAGAFAIKRAKQAKALHVCTEMESAIQRFYDDNGTMPLDVAVDTTVDSNSAEGIELLQVLLDKETVTDRNSKGHKYLNVKQGQNSIDGLIYSADGSEVQGLYDPWGGDYRIVIDGDYDGSITVQPKAEDTGRTLARQVAVWSDGADGAEDGVNGKSNDDVTTW